MYWRKNLRLTAALLVVWAAASFVPGYFADQFNTLSFMGWPLGFYMAAQGAPIVFLLIVWVYDRWMLRLDKQLRTGGRN
ncbi:MAG: DUF4212 domain-containing protein [Zoogloea sp.]|nr:DUF4212 domain-containing protein [Zoogloea sp.]